MATGDSYHTIAYSYRVGKTSVARIIEEVADAIWDCLAPLYLEEIKDEHKWRNIAENFKTSCDFPHCVGAIDGKHVTIKAPPNCGSDYFNYLKDHSIVLLAVTDSKKKIIMIDIGSKGKFSDGGILRESNFGQKLFAGNLNLPPDEALVEGGIEVPYVFIGDEAFPLLCNLMRPFPRENNITQNKRIYNYRLCRARRVVENAFGILSVRWRVYKRPFECKVDTAIKIVKATCVLHNYLMEHSLNYNSVTNEDIAATPVENQLFDLTHSGFRSSNDSFFIREEFCNYFNHTHVLSWQNARVTI